jgi:hypothetical protein
MTTEREALAAEVKRLAAHVLAVGRASFETVPAITELHAAIDALRDHQGEVAEGWKLVPVEPPPAMTWAATVTADREWCYHVGRDDARKLWSAMLAAAPQQDTTK